MTNTPETLNILNPDFRMPEHCGGDRWSILHGDSLQIIRQFVPNSFDAIITDPPYASGGSSQTTKNRSTNEKYSSMSKEKALPDFDSDQMDQLSWMFWTAAWLQDARRIAKPGAPVCLFIDWRQLPAMTLALQWAGWTWRGVAVWDKVASRPQKGRFRQQSEYIVWGSNGKMPLERNVGCLPGVFRYLNPQNRIHVTEKPLQLMRDVVQICEPGGRIPPEMDGHSMWAKEPAQIPYLISDPPANVAKRLKTLGNAVVPPQVYPILRYIAEIETGRCRNRQQGGDRIWNP